MHRSLLLSTNSLLIVVIQPTSDALHFMYMLPLQYMFVTLNTIKIGLLRANRFHQPEESSILHSCNRALRRALS
jgi:hypothetical protein